MLGLVKKLNEEQKGQMLEEWEERPLDPCMREWRLFGSCVCLLIELSLLLKGEHSKLPFSQQLPFSPFFLSCSCFLYDLLIM